MSTTEPPGAGADVRPTLYLTNWGSKTKHGPGRKLRAMAAPRRWEHGDGQVALAAPTLAALRLVQMTGDLSGYRRLLEDRWGQVSRHFSPNHMVIRESNGGFLQYVVDGDSLLCACARPGSKVRKHPCHLELLVPFLVRGGWDVMLDGKRVTTERNLAEDLDASGCLDVPLDETSPDKVVWANPTDAGAPYRPEDFGWPEVRDVG